MAVYDLEEQEQLDELKTWWKQYGNLVTNLMLVVALVVAGWQGWSYWQRRQAAEASMIYFAVQQAVSQGNVQVAREKTGELIAKYPNTAYSGLAALLAARLQVDKGEGKNAKAQLQWTAENAKDSGLRDLARLRLAAVLLDDKAYDEAQKQLAGAPVESLAPRFAELKADVYAAQGKADAARDAYQTALAQLEKPSDETSAGERTAYREIIQTKLDALGSAK